MLIGGFTHLRALGWFKVSVPAETPVPMTVSRLGPNPPDRIRKTHSIPRGVRAQGGLAQPDEDPDGLVG